MNKIKLLSFVPYCFFTNVEIVNEFNNFVYFQKVSCSWLGLNAYEAPIC